MLMIKLERAQCETSNPSCACMPALGGGPGGGGGGGLSPQLYTAMHYKGGHTLPQVVFSCVHYRPALCKVALVQKMRFM